MLNRVTKKLDYITVRKFPNIATYTAKKSEVDNTDVVIIDPESLMDISTKYGTSLSLTIDSSTYVVTAQLKDQDGNNLGTAQIIDLPLESVVVNGSYDSTNEKIVLTLQNGNTIDIPVGDLINGLQSEITAQNPLSADLLADGNTNKVYTATEKTKLAGIQAGAEINVQSDWNQSNSSADDYIKNKPAVVLYTQQTLTAEQQAQVRTNIGAGASGFSGDYTDLTSKPVLNTNNSTAQTVSANETINGTINLHKVSKTGSYNDLDSKPTIPSAINDLSDVDLDSLANGQALVYNSTTQKWENQDIPSGAFICTFTKTTDPQTGDDVYSCDKTIADIIAAANDGKTVLGTIRDSDENNTAGYVPLTMVLEGVVAFAGFIPLGGILAVLTGTYNSSTDTDSWFVENNQFASVAFSGDYGDLSNTPILGTAAALDVAASGNASSTQVVKGDDTRLTDSRPASDVSAWAKAATKPTYTASEVGAIPTTEKDSANGVATLNSNGKIPSHQLPSYVDDVLEYNSYSDFPATGERGKIYVTLDTNKTYRWSGSAYIEISESLALGETSSTAYAGNKGKANADAIAAIKDGTSIDSFGDVETALADKINKSSTAGLVKNDGTIDTNTYLTQHQDISGKADKVSNPTNGNLAKIDANGNLADSGVATSGVSDAVSKKHSHTNKSILDLIPTTLGASGQVLSVGNNSNMEWRTPTSGSVPEELFTCRFYYENNILKCTETVSKIILESSKKIVIGHLKEGSVDNIFLLRSTESRGGFAFFDTIYYSGSIMARCLVGMASNTDVWEFDDFPVPKELPSLQNNANKILAVNSNATNVEWVTPSSGLTNYDFTPNTKITHSSSSTTESITFAANTQGTQWIDTSVDLDMSIACNNDASNYILVNNTGSSDIAVTITGVTHNGTSVTVKLANVDNGEVSVGAGKCREFGILRYSDGYIITNVEL